MPWRERRTPYGVFVSEIMLQQTSIARVSDRYADFLRCFPSFAALARARPADVLAAWQGLGYNRRALALLESARIVTSRYRGRLPRSMEDLSALPGVGPATAGAMLAYAFNLPAPFIETNIRRVFLHFFFPRARKVTDAQLLPLVERTLDRRNPRAWFYGLMDYGAMLALTRRNPNVRSAAYRRQSPFVGSRRQLRGRVLAEMLTLRKATENQLIRALEGGDERLPTVLQSLVAEGFLEKTGARYSLR